MEVSRTAILALVVVALIAVAFYALLKGGEHTSTSVGTPSKVSKRVNLLGSGATFPYPQLSVWITEFHKKHPGIIISYNPTGSGTGQKQFFSKLVDFAASDPPVSKNRWQEWRGKFVQMPFILGGVVVTYNVPEIGNREIKMDAETIALIYRGDIQYWDDPKITSLNPGIKFPHKRIIAVHRSDSSGTTNIFTFFLHKAAPDTWPEELVGKIIEWPVDKKGNGVGGRGNQGVAEILSSTKYSIGYVELAYALEGKMPVALVKNREGKFIKPSAETITAAAAGALSSLPDSPLGDFSNDLDAVIFAPGENSYPLASFSHLLFYTEYDEGKLEAIKEFIKYINTDGQERIAPGYAPIPKQLRELNLKALDILKKS